MYLLTLYFPLISFLLNYLFGRFLGNKGGVFISIMFMSLSLFISIFIFFEVVIFNYNTTLIISDWIKVTKFFVSWNFQFDTLCSIMLLMILSISTIVHVYSVSYMQNDPQRTRFLSLLSLFTFFMLLLITANSFIQLLLGWEGVGICSYLLINFWSDRIAANRAALKALFFNRVGDFGMIIALLLLYDSFKTLQFSIIQDSISFIIGETYDFNLFYISKIDLICFFFVLAAIAKSAQFFLHGWLTDAMEGPTPVSALIHAATMVTAGIFLLARINPLLQFSPKILNLIIIFGIITTVMFSFSGQNTNDLKKIVASSTASQLAYMFFIAGLLDTEASIFHLFLHAFFKALLFLSAGSIIHGLGDQQDIRKMGGLFLLMPFNTFCFSIGSFSLIGLPAATGGYYSKDPIIENTFLLDTYFDDFVNLGSELGVVNTLYYNLKLMRVVFFGHFKGPKIVFAHDASKIIFYCLSILTLLSFIAPLLWEFIISEDSMILSSFSNINNFYKEGDLNFYREEEITSYIFWFLIFICLSSIIHTEEIFSDSVDTLNSIFFYSYYDDIIFADNTRWGIEYFLVKKIIYFFFYLSDFLFFSIDRGILEFFGPMSLIIRIKNFSYFCSNLITGFIYHYVMFILEGILFFSLIYYLLQL
jgi:proton-translocating NADH-quinone oxidoreductase chain L